MRLVFHEHKFYRAPNCLRYFSELAFTFAGGFIPSDFLKLVIAFFLSPTAVYPLAKPTLGVNLSSGWVLAVDLIISNAVSFLSAVHYILAY